MITRPLPESQPEAWREILAGAVTDPAELIALLGLDPALLPDARRAAAAFGLRVPRGFVARMGRGDPSDPLLRQVLPLGAELCSPPGYGGDPVGDLAARRGPGVLRKYRGRALLIASPACAIHCRYCFRREFPYGEETAHADGWRAAMESLAGDGSVEELILSGGDPLTLSNRRLAALDPWLARLPACRRLRIHTRLPVVLPERVDPGLLAWLRDQPLSVALVIHANHANELDGTVAAALARLGHAGVSLLNQAVLLAGVNDSADALAALSERLFDLGVLPYYLHLLDPVRGAAHFDVGEARALALTAALRARLPGYLVPRLVRELPGAESKLPVGEAVL